jgi:hypothetical protein
LDEEQVSGTDILFLRTAVGTESRFHAELPHGLVRPIETLNSLHSHQSHAKIIQEHVIRQVRPIDFIASPLCLQNRAEIARKLTSAASSSCRITKLRVQQCRP